MAAIYRMRFLSLVMEGTAREIADATGLDARLVRNAACEGRPYAGATFEKVRDEPRAHARHRYPERRAEPARWRRVPCPEGSICDAMRERWAAMFA